MPTTAPTCPTLVVKLELAGGTFELWEHMPAPDGWTIEVSTKDARPPVQELAPRPSWENAGTLYAVVWRWERLFAAERAWRLGFADVYDLPLTLAQWLEACAPVRPA